MSDPKSSYGEPVEDPTAVDDVVGSVNEGLADAEAAGRDAVADSEQPSTEAPAEEPAVESEYVAEPAPAEAASVEPEPAEPAYVEPEPAEPAYVEPAESAYPEPTAEEIAAAGAAAAANVEPVHAEPAYVEPAYVEPEADRTGAAAAAGAAAAYAVAPSEQVVQQPVAVAQPIFVQAPEPPRPRGNRAAAGAIGLLATVAFAVLYVAAWLGIGLVTGDITTDDVVTSLTTAASSWVFWLPIVLFFIGFWLLGAIINRGRWAHWVIFGIFVGVISWAGYVLGHPVPGAVLDAHPDRGRRPRQRQPVRAAGRRRLHHRPRADHLVRRVGRRARQARHGAQHRSDARVRAHPRSGSADLSSIGDRNPAR